MGVRDVPHARRDMPDSYCAVLSNTQPCFPQPSEAGLAQLRPTCTFTALTHPACHAAQKHTPRPPPPLPLL